MSETIETFNLKDLSVQLRFEGNAVTPWRRLPIVGDTIVFVGAGVYRELRLADQVVLEIPGGTRSDTLAYGTPNGDICLISDAHDWEWPGQYTVVGPIHFEITRPRRMILR